MQPPKHKRFGSCLHCRALVFFRIHFIHFIHLSKQAVDSLQGEVRKLQSEINDKMVCCSSDIKSLLQLYCESNDLSSGFLWATKFC